MRLHRVVSAVLLVAVLAPVPARAVIVFDPSNFVENALTAAHTLEEINNQVKQLENEAQMLINEATNLTSLPFNILGQLQTTLASTNALISEARGITFRLGEARWEFRRLHPDDYSRWTSATTMALDAQQRWSNSLRALETTIDMQSQAAENLFNDESFLTELVSQSQAAIGALQAVQATNQLLALHVRQATQEQHLRLAEDRSAALERARSVAAEARAREVRRRFQGSGVRYAPATVDFYGLK